MTNHTWCYNIDNHGRKRPGKTVFKLVDIARKGGNYLSNVSPTSEGLIPQFSLEEPPYHR